MRLLCSADVHASWKQVHACTATCSSWARQATPRHPNCPQRRACGNSAATNPGADLAGAQAGTLTPANAGDGVLTLTGWSAALGLLAIVVVAVVGAGLAYRRYKGYDQMSTYTLVNKTAGRA